MTGEHRLLVRHPQPFPAGVTVLVPGCRAASSDAASVNSMDFAVVVQSPGETLRETSPLETAWLLLAGEARVSWNDARATVRRDSLFDQDPIALHVPPGTPVAVEALTAVEWVRVRTANDETFPATLFDATSMLESERRDAGLWDDLAHRVVRTIFDTRNRPTAKLVLGEVINLPGRWSSYPPHHHPHPEIYHYRFTAPQGYGHGEVGDEVVKVRQGDTLLIPGGHDHSQVAAPGYGMYYVWVIRHLPGNPYVVPEFTEAHRWLKAPGAVIPRIGGKA